MYRDHRKGPGGPPGGATYPGGPHGLKWGGDQPLVGWCAPPGPPSAPRVGNPRGGGASTCLGGQVSRLGRRPPRRSHLLGPAPPPGGPPGGATCPGGLHGLKWEGNQPLVGWGAPHGPPPAPPSQGAYIKGGGRAAILQPLAPPSSPATPLPLAEARRSPAEIPLHPPPRRRAAGSPSTSPSPLLDQEGGDVAAPYVC